MTRTDWNGKRVVVVGVARQGIALARYLINRGAKVILNDRRPVSELQPLVEAALSESINGAPGSVEYVFGDHPVEILEGVELLCPSGGVPLSLPLVKEAIWRGIPLSNDSQIFLEATPSRVIGITGSAGKTTTTTLVGRMAHAALAEAGNQHKAFVGGNIGTPLINQIDEMHPGDLAVMELSSFQLEIMSRSPQVAAILNITPNHLDRHASMDDYTSAKARILEFQGPNEVAVLGRDDPGSWNLKNDVQGRLISFGSTSLQSDESGTFTQDGLVYLQNEKEKTRLFPCDLIELRGEHNMLNVLAACAIAFAAGFSPAAMQAGVAGFRGVPHRLEFVRSYRGADWYNDSIATAPERAMAAIRSFDEPLILLAGGRDKNLPWHGFSHLVRERAAKLVLFGEAAPKIAQVLDTAIGNDVSDSISVTICKGLQDAVQAAAELVEPGSVVLLSPGATSFDEFNDFEERGEAFRQWVMRLP